MEFNIKYYFENLENSDEIFVKDIIKDSTNILDMYKNSKSFMESKVSKKHIQENHATNIGNNVTIVGDYYIGEGTKLCDGCRIEGPVYIGKNCEIGYQAYVRPGTIMGDNCVIGFNSEVKNSVMRSGSKVSSLAFLGDSILGANARIGSGVITANRQFNQENIFVKMPDGTRIDSEREFFGCVLGDNSRIGANATTSPGTFIGPYTWIYPLTPTFGFIPAQKRVYKPIELEFKDNNRKELKKATWRG